MTWLIVAYLTVGLLVSARVLRSGRSWLAPWARWRWERAPTGEPVDVRSPPAEWVLRALVCLVWPLYALCSWVRNPKSTS